ncbi:DNA-binding protein [Tumebacillus avium]|uniref:DNA-binding protein n=1 Tax=Tumebacillus avium TaxID=1903704 RepID=A0A1Y0IU43_9BACL|nr:helix-turn-helix transcriptional regulator [Tumebacillus avium]ARU62844.1 DNA-binding protein [Tumebacillus avium]
MDIGCTIRAIRKRKGLTIPQLCEGTGLSRGFISNVENNKTSPSIASLELIANFLNVPITYFFMTDKERMSVVRKEERKVKSFGIFNIEYLTTDGPLRVMLVGSKPGDVTGETHFHEGYECHLVLKGRYRAEHGSDSVILEEGDAFSWNASIPHNVINIGDTDGLLLIASYKE